MTDNTPTVSPLPPLDVDIARNHALYLCKAGLLAIADTIDALLARVLTPEEAEVAARALRFHDTSFSTGHPDLAVKLGQIAGDR